MIEPQRQNREMQVRLEVGSKLDQVECDPDLLRIVVTNLFGNAVKYGLPGGKIRVIAQRLPEGVRVSVWNEGRGFSANRRPLLFRKFSRLADPEAKGNGGIGGTGIGLYTAWRIILAHQGRIDAQSDPGHWAEFFFTLPQPIPNRSSRGLISE
jgi:signal transduction histidine kinase